MQKHTTHIIYLYKCIQKTPDETFFKTTLKLSALISLKYLQEYSQH